MLILVEGITEIIEVSQNPYTLSPKENIVLALANARVSFSGKIL